MKASKFSDAQKAFILKQGADGIGGDQPGDILQLEESVREISGLGGSVLTH